MALIKRGFKSVQAVGLLTYEPTGDMISDYFTKPLQEIAFKKFKALVLGWDVLEIMEPITEVRKLDPLSNPRMLSDVKKIKI